ncbi:hypothetical protein ES703_52767 [subsurface metagenome]
MVPESKGTFLNSVYVETHLVLPITIVSTARTVPGKFEVVPSVRSKRKRVCASTGMLNVHYISVKPDPKASVSIRKTTPSEPNILPTIRRSSRRSKPPLNGPVSLSRIKYIGCRGTTKTPISNR